MRHISRFSGSQRQPLLWPLIALLWAIIALLDATLAAVLPAMPWAKGLLWWVLPGAVAGGFLLGVLLILSTTTSSRWWLRTSALGLCAVGAIAWSGLLVAQGEENAHASLLAPLLLCMFAAGYPILLPWLVVRARQVWLALALWWLLMAGVWNMHPSAQQAKVAEWLAGSLVLSLTLVGTEWLCVEVTLWRALNLQRVRVGAWQRLRSLGLLTALVTCLAFLPLELLQSSILTTYWQRLPISQYGVIPYRSSSVGAPVAVLGAPLSLDAQSSVNHQALFRYTILSGLPQNALLLGETFDQFDRDEEVWKQAPVAEVVEANSGLYFPPAAQLLRARVTLVAAPDISAPPLLVGFSQPIAFTLPAGATPYARALTATAPTTLTVADWRLLAPLPRGTVYETASAVLPANVRPVGTLPLVLQQRMTQTPSTLTSYLHSVATQWVPRRTLTSQAVANELLMALRKRLVLDPHAPLPPAGTDPIRWGIAHGRANGILFTTIYVLLGRALGLPLRLAEGYLPGQYDAAMRQIVVHVSDGTIWAQLAIPGQGWEDIETIARPQVITVVRSPVKKPTPKKTKTNKTPTPTSRLSAGSGESLRHSSLGDWLLTGIQLGVGLLLGMVLLLCLVGGGVAWRWARLGRNQPSLTRFFLRVGVLARLSGIPLQASDTSAEGIAKIAATLDDRRYLEERHVDALQDINAVYERITYGPPRPIVTFPEFGDLWRFLQRSLLHVLVLRSLRRTPQHPDALGRAPLQKATTDHGAPETTMRRG